MPKTKTSAVDVTNDPELALDACETQLRLVAREIHTMFPNSREWEDIVQACKRAGRLRQRALDRLRTERREDTVTCAGCLGVGMHGSNCRHRAEVLPQGRYNK